METKYIVLIIVAVVMVAALIAAYLYAKKVEKKQAEQTEQLKAAAQTISMLVIDKKRMKMKEMEKEHEKNIISYARWNYDTDYACRMRFCF